MMDIKKTEHKLIEYNFHPVSSKVQFLHMHHRKKTAKKRNEIVQLLMTLAPKSKAIYLMYERLSLFNLAHVISFVFVVFTFTMFNFKFINFCIYLPTFSTLTNNIYFFKKINNWLVKLIRRNVSRPSLVRSQIRLSLFSPQNFDQVPTHLPRVQCTIALHHQ